MKAIDTLFNRVVTILERARSNVVRNVNSEMVLAYWHIGRELVEKVQLGEGRAKYGRRLVDDLSNRLVQRYGNGFSATNLRYFRLFYQVYSDRSPVIHHKACDELTARGFSSELSWSHYRTLTKVELKAERLFYEIETAKQHWSVPQLERQIHTMLFTRLLKSRDKAGVLALASQGQHIQKPVDAIKDPYVLDFLDLPESDRLHETTVESAITTKLQAFLLELGKGFAFVARQMRLSYDDEHFYVDLVFYNTILKCYLLIDLKAGKLTHQDIGQMDSYVRLFDDRYTTKNDNPTVGLILCAEKNLTVAKYSVLSGSKRLFAAKYLTYLPSEKQLRQELKRERASIA